MKKIDNYQKYIKLLAWAVFAGVLLVLSFFLWRYTRYTLDADASSELVLAKHLADQGGGILSKNWYYSTEVKFLNDQLAFELLFLFTDNWRVVRMGGTLLLIALMLVSLYYFCRGAGVKKSFPLVGALVLLPLSEPYFKYALKFAYYIPYIITAFVVLGAVIRFPAAKGRKGCAEMVLAALLSLAAGMLGFRMILILYIPLVMAALLYLWLNGADASGKKLAAGAGFLTGSALAGCLINQTVIVNSYTFHDYTTLSFTGFSLDGLERVINGLLDILGYRAGAQVFSSSLLPCALSGVLFLLCIYCGGYILLHRDRFSATQQLAAYYYFSAILALCLVYSLTDMDYMSYHSIPTAIHGLTLPFICFERGALFGKTGNKVILSLMCFALLCGALSYNQMRKEDKTRALREAAQFLAESDYTEGYASFWIGNLTTELSNGAVDMWVWNDIGLAELEDPDEIVPWLQSKAHDDPPAAGKVFILLTANEAYYCEFTKNFTEDNVIFRTANYEPGAIDEYIIYGFDSYDEMRELFVGQ